MESVFVSLKAELVHEQHDPTREAAKRDLFGDIEGDYNRQRRHSTFGCITPEQAERRAAWPGVHSAGGSSYSRSSYRGNVLSYLAKDRI